MTRHFWVLIHRYAGLTMAFFLIVAGLTGSILAFYHELDNWLNEEGSHAPKVAVLSQPMLDPFALREKALALVPHARINSVTLQLKPDEAYAFALEPRIDPSTDQPYPLGFDTLELNPYTGERILKSASELPQPKAASYWPLTRKNILPFIYELHYSLALGEVGTWLFGIAAIIWTLDCFVGFYLTLPIRRKRNSLSDLVRHSGRDCRNPEYRDVELTLPSMARMMGNREVGRTFWQRWQIAWKIKRPSSTPRLNFDLHRAGGLWVWPMLFIFAWSSVSLNINIKDIFLARTRSGLA